MKAPFVIPLMLIIAPTEERGPVFAGMPPERFQHDSIGIVAYVTDIETYCGEPEPGNIMLGCRRVIDGASVQFLRNPCQFGDDHWYPRIACHEAAHHSGWGGNHEL